MSTVELDITELRARVRGLAHDVRTPLTSIAGFAQLLIEDGSLSSDSRENSEIIIEEAKKLSSMLEGFCDEVTAKLDGPPPAGLDEN